MATDEVVQLVQTYNQLKVFAWLYAVGSVLAPASSLMSAFGTARRLRKRGGVATAGANWPSGRRARACWRRAVRALRLLSLAVHVLFALALAFFLRAAHKGNVPNGHQRWQPSEVVCDVDFVQRSRWRACVLSAYTLLHGTALLLPAVGEATRHRRSARAVAAAWFLLMWELVSRESGLVLPIALVHAIDRAVHCASRATACTATAIQPVARLCAMHTHVVRPLTLVWLLAYASEAFRTDCGKDMGGAALAVVLVTTTLAVRLLASGSQLLASAAILFWRSQLAAARYGAQAARSHKDDAAEAAARAL